MAWTKDLVEWTDGDTAYISVVFSWLLDKAYQRAVWHRAEGKKVVVGGPGTVFHQDFFEGVADIGLSAGEVVTRYNPEATFASRGCPVGCGFCIVSRLEGKEFTLLPDFTPRPILCDNNLSALPVDYQKHIIQRYQETGIPLLDAQQGFEPATFDEDTFQRWQAINRGPWRFGYDESKEGEAVYRMTRLLRDVPAHLKRVFVMIGNEPMADCLDRIQRVIDWGCEPHVQPYIPYGSLKKEPAVKFDWTLSRLYTMARWANRWIWRTAPFSEYTRAKQTEEDEAQWALF